MPSLTRSGRPSSSWAARAPSGSASTALRARNRASSAARSVMAPMLDCRRSRRGACGRLPPRRGLRHVRGIGRRPENPLRADVSARTCRLRLHLANPHARARRGLPARPAAQAQAAPPGADPRRPGAARGDLDRVRDDDRGLQRPAGARERGRVPGRAQLAAAGRQQAPRADRQAHRQQQPHPAERAADLADARERGGRDRGPPLLPPRGSGLQGHRPRPRAGHPPPPRGPGRLHHHPAVRQERALGPGRPLGVPEAARGRAGLPPRAQVEQAEGAHPVPQQRLLRQRRLRGRGRGADLLRQDAGARRRPRGRARRARRGRPAGGDDRLAEHVRPGREPRQGPRAPRPGAGPDARAADDRQDRVRHRAASAPCLRAARSARPAPTPSSPTSRAG